MCNVLDAVIQCAPQVSPVLMQALVRTESAGNPYAIGPDSGHAYVKQPKSLQEAVKTAQELKANGHKFSVGLAQIHMNNVEARGLTWEQAFEPCKNLQLGQAILFDFYRKAQREGYTGIDAIWATLRGYNSGGVHRTVSDKYAHKIFTYMQQGTNKPPVPTQIKPVLTTPASTNPSFIQLAPTIQPSAMQMPGQLAVPMASAETQPTQAVDKDAVRKGESADIFQREGEEKQGF